MGKITRFVSIIIFFSTFIYADLFNDNSYEGAYPDKKYYQKKVNHKVIIYHCSSKAFRASGWAESTNLNKAMRGAHRQCMIRRVSNQPCIHQNCYIK